VSTTTHSETAVAVLTGDLDHATFERLTRGPTLAWDIETTGLDWKADQLGTVQIYDGEQVVLVRQLEDHPRLLRHLLEDREITKLLHHAMFDLRFMASAWNAAPANVTCTKVAAKLLRIPRADQSLAPLVERYLGVRLDKQHQVSDWTGGSLSEAQLKYAAGDVCYLIELMARLRADLEAEGRWALAEACFAHLPTRVILELEGFEDVFVY
jgi:ribonuclease D